MSSRLILYIRKNDPAGKQAREWSDALQAEFPHLLDLRDVDTRPDWKEAFGAIAPVAELDGRRLAVPITQVELKSALALGKAIGQYRKETHVPKPIQALSNSADRMAMWFSRHWLAAFNGFIAVYLGLALLAPVLLKLGAARPASWIYTIYSYSCHQLGYRSFYLFGEALVIPRDEFVAVTGIDPNDLWAARAFTGNSSLGYKIALCQRDVAIYSLILLGGIAFHFLRGKIKPLHWTLWLLLGVFPMGLDGGTQLLSYLPFLDFPLRESTPLLRVITGSLFGLTSVWFAYPYVQESMDEDLAGKPSGRA
ncbi:MAG: DUF2085 domain-containing protein [Anaerolineales bacterium]|nr:DUF2085 domain-containing protein [Anaerolineales bacterium]